MSEPVKVVRTKAFRVTMSKGDPIKIDEDEIDGVVEGMNNGSVIIVKRGIINPSYLVSIDPDGERIQEWNRDCQRSYGGQGELARKNGIKSLDSIFGKTKIGKAIEARKQQKLTEAKGNLKLK